jgi:hypothetical protein
VAAVVSLLHSLRGGGGNPIAQAVKMSQKVLPLLWAAELAPHGITVITITPGFLRSESMLQHFAVTEDNWREAGKNDPNFLQSESPLLVGRAVAALAAPARAGDPWRTGAASVFAPYRAPLACTPEIPPENERRFEVLRATRSASRSCSEWLGLTLIHLRITVCLFPAASLTDLDQESES